MRLRLETDKCAGHAVCHAMDADLFPLDDNGYSAVQSTALAPQDVGRAQDGVNACPERALLIDE
ncbi:ferredoxin [Nocardia barduliensis]|uniref:ferredoxin n=1 Tax=Nocardia barduliensis TaxID=2736643 RepID=UPI0015746294|nr:ferredoxin [Nocardia barduliensis]